jgi:hypothetical protein
VHEQPGDPRLSRSQTIQTDMSSWRVNRANELRLILTSPDNHRLFTGIGLFRRDCLACAGYLGRICGGVVPGGVSGRRGRRRQRLRPPRLRGPVPAALRITTTSWSLRSTPGWAWQPERRDPIWSHGSAVTCWAGANWSSPTSAPDRVLASARSAPDPYTEQGHLHHGPPSHPRVVKRADSIRRGGRTSAPLPCVVKG